MTTDLEGWHLSKSIPISIIVFMIFQTVALIIWATRLETRVSYLELDQTRQDVRISFFDDVKTRLTILEETDKHIVKRLDVNAAKIDAILAHMQIPIPTPRD